MTLRHMTIALGLVAVLALAGCLPKRAEAPAPLPQKFLQENWSAQEVPVAHLVRRDYRLREGDKLEIIYHVKHKRSEFYRFKIEDEVIVRFPFHPLLNQIESVHSDGTLRLDLIGAVPVVDRTIGEVHRDIAERY